MADLSPDRNPDTDVVSSARDRPPRTPRWVQAFGIVGLVLIILIVVQLLLGVQHGPGMHAPPSDESSARVQLPEA
jgi:hypothetical protein